MRDNQALKSDVPAKFYGFEFTGTATSLQDQTGQVIGGIAVQVRRQSELKAILFNPIKLVEIWRILQRSYRLLKRLLTKRIY